VGKSGIPKNGKEERRSHDQHLPAWRDGFPKDGGGEGKAYDATQNRIALGVAERDPKDNKGRIAREKADDQKTGQV